MNTMNKRTRFHLHLIAMLACAFAANAQAGTIRIAVQAEVTSIHDPHGYLAGKIGIGDTIVGSYTYDTSLPDLAMEDPYWGFYIHTQPGYGISLRVNGLLFRTDFDDPWFTMTVAPDDPQLGLDYAFQAMESSKNLFYLSVPGVGEPINRISMSLGDHTSPFELANDALPGTAPVLSNWDSAVLNLYSRNGDISNRFSVNARITHARMMRCTNKACLWKPWP